MPLPSLSVKIEGMSCKCCSDNTSTHEYVVFYSERKNEFRAIPKYIHEHRPPQVQKTLNKLNETITTRYGVRMENLPMIVSDNDLPQLYEFNVLREAAKSFRDAKKDQMTQTPSHEPLG